MPELGTIAAKITADPSGFESALIKASQLAKTFANTVQGYFASAAKALATAWANPIGLISTGFGLIINMGKKYLALAEEIGVAQVRLQRQFGLTNEAAAGLQLTARERGISADDLGNSLRAFSLRVQQASGRGGENARTGAIEGGSAERALREIGLDARDLARLNLQQQLAAIGDGLRGITNPSDRAALSLQILGTRAGQLRPFLNQGSEGMAQAEERAKAMGLAMGETAENMVRAQRAMQQLKVAWEALDAKTGVSIASATTKVQLGLATLGQSFINSYNQRGVLGVLGHLFSPYVAVLRFREAVEQNQAAAYQQEMQEGRNQALNSRKDLMDNITNAIGLNTQRLTWTGSSAYQNAAAAFERFKDNPRLSTAEVQEAKQRLDELFNSDQRVAAAEFARELTKVNNAIGFSFQRAGEMESKLRQMFLEGKVGASEFAAQIDKAINTDLFGAMRKILADSPMQTMLHQLEQIESAWGRGIFGDNSVDQIENVQRAIDVVQLQFDKLENQQRRLAPGAVAGSAAAQSLINESRISAAPSDAARRQEERDNATRELLRQQLDRLNQLADGIRIQNIAIANLN